MGFCMELGWQETGIVDAVGCVERVKGFPIIHSFLQ